MSASDRKDNLGRFLIATGGCLGFALGMAAGQFAGNPVAHSVFVSSVTMVAGALLALFFVHVMNGCLRRVAEAKVQERQRQRAEEKARSDAEEADDGDPQPAQS